MERSIQNRRVNDFPELQIGYPERNDVRDPNSEMERYHVNLDNFKVERATAERIIKEIREPGSPQG
jgi:hypothetical protein